LEKEIYYNKTIYCYVEEQGERLNEFILKYNNESIIHIIPSIIESCDKKLLYCLCDIITNYVKDDKNADTRYTFVTDVRRLYNIVERFYNTLFEEIIYIEQDNKKEFDNEIEIEELIKYFLNIQRSFLNTSFMRKLWNLKNSINKNEFMKFLYGLRGVGIEKEDCLKRLWNCFCNILLYEFDYSKFQNKSIIYKLSIYSILMALDKNADYTNKYLSEVLENNEINAENMYFIYHQFKRMSFTRQAIMDKQSVVLLNKLYDKCYNNFMDNLKEYIHKIPLEKRDKNAVMIIAVQFLDNTHAPTKTVIERIKVLSTSGKKVVLVNTAEICLMNGYLPIYMIEGANYFEKYENINKIKKADLRRSLGIVLQDTHLFTGTVMENIRYGKLDATDEECIAAAKLANAHSFIKRLPDGYNTVLTGDGANLSQGQRQLLAIARAAIADPPVLILDEATSSIDTRTEKIVQ